MENGVRMSLEGDWETMQGGDTLTSDEEPDGGRDAETEIRRGSRAGELGMGGHGDWEKELLCGREEIGIGW